MKNLLSVVLLSLSIGAFGQLEFKVPENYRFKEKEDYKKYEKEFIEACEWLMTTPVQINKKNRKEVSQFVLKYIMGSPDVMIEISDLAMFSSSNEYLTIFMAGWSVEHLKTRKFDDKLSGCMAGIKAVIEFYESNSEYLGKDKKIKKYIKLKKKGKLEHYIKKQMS